MRWSKSNLIQLYFIELCRRQNFSMIFSANFIRWASSCPGQNSTNIRLPAAPAIASPATALTTPSSISSIASVASITSVPSIVRAGLRAGFRGGRDDCCDGADDGEQEDEFHHFWGCNSFEVVLWSLCNNTLVLEPIL